MVMISLWRARAISAYDTIQVLVYRWLHTIPNIKEITMTVEDLKTAKKIVEEAPDMVACIYEYHHAITNKKLYSIESIINRGATELSGYVINPRIIYTPENGWSV